MRRAAPSDVPWMIECHRNRGDSSFVALSSAHGFSESELRSMLSEASSGYFVSPDNGNLIVSIHDMDFEHGQSRIQICANDACEAPDAFLKHLMQTHGIHRVTSYVFPQETCEIKILTALGFTREAVFREHFFTGGSYSDIVIYGLMAERP